MKEHETNEEFEATHEDIPDEPELEDIEESAGNSVKKLRAKLVACEKEKMTHLEELQRTKADFLNSKKRLHEQFERDTRRITRDHILALLPLADSFDMAMQSDGWEKGDETWKSGIKAIRAQLASILSAHGVRKVAETGVPFDPHKHEAVSESKTGHAADADHVVTVLQAGYEMDGEVIRHAKVIVGA